MSATALGYLEVPDGRISKLHCMIHSMDKVGLPPLGKAPPRACAEDQSANGTFLNGKRLAKGEQVALRQGDRLSIVLSLSPMLERSLIVHYGECPRFYNDTHFFDFLNVLITRWVGL